MSKEATFLNALQQLFVGTPVEGQSGFINLMAIKARYFQEGVHPHLMQDIEEVLQPFPDFREELFDKLYTFFQRYFSESGSIYFRYTPLHQSVYEHVYRNDRDVMLFWKTHMLYYVKTDRLFQSMHVEVDSRRFFFDASPLTHKRSNEKRSLIYEYQGQQGDTLRLAVQYSERGRKTDITALLRSAKQAGITLKEETLQRAFGFFERQSEVDFFINKDARAFLREQFDLWAYQYFFADDSEWSEGRIRQLQALREIAYKIIDFIAQFEDELARIWNKPKFVLDSHYVITLDRIGERDEALLRRLLEHSGMQNQIAEWRDLGIVGEDFELTHIWHTDLFGERLHDQFQYLPLDTRHFPDQELEILTLFDSLDAELDGWLINSENYQALNTLLPKFGGNIKAIYADPPYNTSASEIKYINDYRHASWLTLMENRLRLARELLRRDGILCITIDDAEYHRLHGLLIQVFGDEDDIRGTIAIRSNPAGRSTVKGFSIAHEYAIFVSRSDEATIGRLPRTERQIARYGERDQESAFEWVNFRKHGGVGANRAARPRMYYPIYATPTGNIRIPAMAWNESNKAWDILESPGTDETAIWPINDKGEEKRWKWKHDSVATKLQDFCARPDRTGGLGVYMKSRMNTAGTLPITWWSKEEYSATDYGTNLLGHILGNSRVFDYPKSVHAVEDCLRVANLGEEEICLDFFGGSGTTAHAVINLNREDGAQRKYILVEMAAHFDEVLLPRVKKVIFSDRWRDGSAQEGGSGTSHFLKYFRLEQYEDVLQRASYGQGDLFMNPYEDPYSSYIFRRDLKLLDGTVELDDAGDAVRVNLDRLYDGIDVAETLSCLTGKAIRRITAETVEFEDGSTANLSQPDWDQIKRLIWW